MKKLCKRMRMIPLRKHEEGVALVIALLILVMLTVVGLVAIISSSTETQIATNAKGSTQSLYLAEAGVAQVSWWFKKPDTFTIAGHFMVTSPAYGGTPIQFFTQRRQGNTSYLDGSNVSQYTGSSSVPDLLFNSTNVGDTDDVLLNDPTSGIFRNLSTFGRVTQLMVYAPSTVGNICTVRVRAEARVGGTRTIEQELAPNPIPPLAGPMQSGLGASWNGNGTIHWGQVLVQGNANLQNNMNQVPYQYKNGAVNSRTFDRWFNVSISGTYANAPGGVGVPNPYSTVCTNNPDGGSYSQVCHNNLQQNQSVNIQKWDYQTMKDMSVANSQYYVYANGAVHVGSPTGPVVDLNTLMTSNSGFVFIDTPNQKDPAAGGTSFTLSQSGNPGDTITGAFYVAGNLSFGGLGGGNNVSATPPPNGPCTSDGSGPCPSKPPGEQEDPISLSVNIKGVLYSTGTMDFQGSPVIFGAVVAERGFGSGGTPDIWYDWSVRSNNWGNMPPAVKKLWREVRTD